MNKMRRLLVIEDQKLQDSFRYHQEQENNQLTKFFPNNKPEIYDFKKNYSHSFPYSLSLADF